MAVGPGAWEATGDGAELGFGEMPLAVGNGMVRCCCVSGLGDSVGMPVKTGEDCSASQAVAKTINAMNREIRGAATIDREHSCMSFDARLTLLHQCLAVRDGQPGPPQPCTVLALNGSCFIAP